MGASSAWRDCAPGVASWKSSGGLMGASMTVTSRGNTRATRKAMEKVFSKPSEHAGDAEPTVVVGLLAPAAMAPYVKPPGFGESDGSSVVQLAVYNEYGTDTIPPRPWFGPMSKEFAAEAAPACAAMAAALIADGNIFAFEAGLAALGRRGVEKFKKYPLETNIPPANEPAYAKRKAKIGRTHTRDLTGQTGEAISYVVEGV